MERKYIKKEEKTMMQYLEKLVREAREHRIKFDDKEYKDYFDYTGLSAKIDAFYQTRNGFTYDFSKAKERYSTHFLKGLENTNLKSFKN